MPGAHLCTPGTFPFLNAISAFSGSLALAHEAEQKLEHVDEVQIQRQRAHHRHLVQREGGNRVRVGHLHALDLQRIAPSVNVSTSFGTTQINIRGLGYMLENVGEAA